jgi:hypothetical protein
MTYRVIIEPTAEREIRSAVRWMIANASPAVAARWYDGLLKNPCSAMLSIEYRG